jgi:hypothetical protein
MPIAMGGIGARCNRVIMPRSCNLVYLRMKDGQTLLTVEPGLDETNRWLETHRPDFQNITVE